MFIENLIDYYFWISLILTLMKHNHDTHGENNDLSLNRAMGTTVGVINRAMGTTVWVINM